MLPLLGVVILCTEHVWEGGALQNTPAVTLTASFSLEHQSGAIVMPWRELDCHISGFAGRTGKLESIPPQGQGADIPEITRVLLKILSLLCLPLCFGLDWFILKLAASHLILWFSNMLQIELSNFTSAYFKKWKLNSSLKSFPAAIHWAVFQDLKCKWPGLVSSYHSAQLAVTWAGIQDWNLGETAIKLTLEVLYGSSLPISALHLPSL